MVILFQKSDRKISRLKTDAATAVTAKVTVDSKSQLKIFYILHQFLIDETDKF